jgi:hypothetical protein
MGIVARAKGELVKTALAKVVDGNTGSSLLGVVSVAILGSGIQFADLFGPDQTKQMHAAGLIAGAVVVGIWSWAIGRKNAGPVAMPTGSK